MKTLILIVGVGFLFSISVMSASAKTSPVAATASVDDFSCQLEYSVGQWVGDCYESSGQYFCSGGGHVGYCDQSDRLCEEDGIIFFEVTYQECTVIY